MKLNNIAEIRTGIVLSRKKAVLESNIATRYRVLTLKSMKKTGEIDESLLDDFDSTERLNRAYLTNENDVVIKLTDPFTAVHIIARDQNLLLSSNLAVIRITNTDYIPGYVALYLNSDKGKHKLKKISSGNTIPIINTSRLKNVDIRACSVSDQKKLVELNQLMLKEKKLLKDLVSEREKQMRSIFNKSIQ
jgi:restriction endonuclease S subunit